MATEKDLLHLVPGQRVVVSKCGAREHSGEDACVCALIGTQQTMGEKIESVFAGTSSWQLVGIEKRVRLTEITFLRSE